METVGSSDGFQDRKVGLVIFGILTALMGGLCALFVPLMFFGQSMAARSGVPQSSIHTLLPAAIMYGLMAVLFLSLGIGSIMARRWARALLLILSWSWLLMGVMALVLMVFVLPQVMEGIRSAQPAGQPQMPPEASSVFLWVMMIFLAIIYVIVPGIWVLFYRSRHVKATCEARDPVVRWTDRAPLPVIAACLWAALLSATLLMLAGVYHGFLPMFGDFVSGPLGIALCVAGAAACAYAAKALYHLQWSGWWIVVAGACLFAVSSFLTYSRHEITEVYVLMGYSEQELAMLQKYNFWKGHTLAWTSLCGMLPYLGYMVYLRRFFPRPGSSTEDPQHS